jgi:hypothetical protein
MRLGRGRSPAFPRLRWVAAAFVVVWAPSYAVVWGWRNFLQLCDVAVFLTALGVWRGSPLLLSSQALSSLVVDALWTLDVGARLASGQHLIGGTQYMWDETRPLPVRLLSLFHVALPICLVYCLRKPEVGYDRRALPAQIALAALVLAASRLLGEPGTNPNFAFRDPFWGRQWGAATAHVGLVLGVLSAAVYLPTHLLLARVLPPSRR